MLIEFKEVGFTYMPGTAVAQPALNTINLRVEKGEFIGIIGPTGSGKSTLLQHLNGLLMPSRGRVLLDGQEIGTDVPLDEVRQRVGMVFQFPESQLFEETVEADIAFGPKNMGVDRDKTRVRVQEALTRVGLDFKEFSRRSPFAISGGEKRLVAIAGVLAMRPDVLVLDEPTSGLDARGKKRITDLICELNGGGVTIVMVSHDMDEVAELARRVVVLNQGRVELDGPPEHVFEKGDLLREIGLGISKSAELITKLRSRGLNLAAQTVTTTGTVSAILDALKERQCR